MYSFEVRTGKVSVDKKTADFLILWDFFADFLKTPHGRKNKLIKTTTYFLSKIQRYYKI